MDPRLRKAAETDDTTALYALIEENAEILKGFDEMPFVETPLHIAAAKGHIEFAMQMVNLKPSFARKLNQSLRSPLHLAVENGQTQMARWLLKTDVDLLRLKGIDGKTPFHLAVKEENLDFLAEFIASCPECISDRAIEGSNALHLAIKGDKHKAAKLLVKWFYWDLGNLEFAEEPFNARDVNGDTPLHIAAKKQSIQSIRLLSQLPTVDKNLENLENKTALDILKDEKRSLSLQEGNAKAISILQRAGGSTAASLKNKQPFYKKLRSVFSFLISSLWKAMLRSRKSFTDNQSDAMLVASVLVITIAFQGVLSPPGGVFQASNDDSSNTNFSEITSPTSLINNEDKSKSSTSPQKPPGKSVMPKDKFFKYWLFNTFALMAGFAVTICFLPPGLVSHLFVVFVSLLLYCYQISTSIISPVPGLDTCSLVINCITYFLLSLYFIAWYRSYYRRIWYFWTHVPDIVTEWLPDFI